MRASIKWVDEAMFVGETESGHAIVIDGPPEGGGRNMGARPMELLLLGMGGCTAYDVVHMLKKGRHQITACCVELNADRAQSVPRVFTRIHVHYRIRGRDLSDKAVQRAVQLTTEKYCSASIMLSKAVTVTHDYEIIQDV